jgi:pimeloyl-ACP methyl ester carboxylesterase
MTGDIVIIGGYRGSILRSANPPHRQIWAPLKIGLNLRKVDLELGLDPEDEERVEETVIPSGMLQNIGPVDIARRLFRRIRNHGNVRNGTLRVHDWGYDWRLSPHLLSRKLLAFVEALPCNRSEHAQSPRGAYIIAHSLGGLIVRHAVNQRPELFAGVVFAATPHRCVNILGPLRNGDSVLFSENVLTAKANFSMRTTFLLLPEDGYCFISNDKTEEYPVDFFNVDDWIKYRWSPCISKALPPYNAKPDGGTSLTSLLKIPASINLPNLPLRRSAFQIARFSNSPTVGEVTKDRTIAPQMDSSSAPQAATEADGRDEELRKNIAYLTRTLAEVKRFRLELAHQPAHQAANRYPPFAVIYGKDTPTVYAGRVTCREAIAHSDAYDNLAFQSGDGVVLATAAMPPEGYELVRAGRVSSPRGHVTMLGDLDAVGKALGAVVRGMQKGIGLGIQEGKC